jgi:hypothetical protein
MKLKFLFLIAIFILSSTITINAQNDDDKKIGGIRAGWQYAGLFQNGAILEGADPLNSFYVGIFRENKILPLLAIGTGIEYSPVGAIDNEFDSKITLHYISVPIDVRLKLGPLFAMVGVAANFRVAEKWRLLGEDFTPPDDSKSEFFDLPVFFGVGVKVFMFRIEARYYWGLLDIYKKNDVFDATKGQYLQIGLGVSF